jgi:hypothetical protein
MNEHLNEAIRRLAMASNDRDLASLDVEIGRGIRLLRRDAQAASALGTVRLASIGLALAMGATIGGVAARAAITAPPAYGTFPADAHLAPSTILEGGR